MGNREPDSGKLVLSPRRTLPTADAFVREFHTHPDGVTLRTYANMLMELNVPSYRAEEAKKRKTSGPTTRESP